jgi:hypothetical protein
MAPGSGPRIELSEDPHRIGLSGGLGRAHAPHDLVGQQLDAVVVERHLQQDADLLVVDDLDALHEVEHRAPLGGEGEVIELVVEGPGEPT